MSKQRVIEQPKTGEQPSIIPVTEALNVFFHTCSGANVAEHLDAHVRTLHVLIREDNLDIKA